MVAQILEAKGAVTRMAEEIFAFAKKSTEGGAVTGAALNDKFAAGAGFDMVHGTQPDYFNGLEVRIGSPSPRVLEQMADEHCNEVDSEIPWTTGNYGITTTSKLEFLLVAWEIIDELHSERADSYPQEWRDAVAKLARMKDSKKPEKWPSETKNTTHPCSDCRTMHFMQALKEKNDVLKTMGEKQLLIEEALALRLYTGPLFEKYNIVNRGGALDEEKTPSFMKKRFLELCGGKDHSKCPNRYCTTNFVLTSGIIKTSKMTKAETVWRGISGGRLPLQFWKANATGVRGGVEYAFMSTTTDRKAGSPPCRGISVMPMEVHIRAMDDRRAARSTYVGIFE